MSTKQSTDPRESERSVGKFRTNQQCQCQPMLASNDPGQVHRHWRLHFIQGYGDFGADLTMGVSGLAIGLAISIAGDVGV